MKNKNNDDDHQPIGEVLKQFVQQNRLQHGLDNVSAEEIWYREMGPAIKSYTTSIQLKKNTLYVRLNSSVLREELSYGKSKIIRNLNEALGKELVKKLILL